MRKFVLSLCDYTGNFVKPWVDNGYKALLVDLQHPEGLTDEGRVFKFGYDITKGIDGILQVLDGSEVAFVSAFPPCTDLAISGARWFKEKEKIDPEFQKKAMDLVMDCWKIGNYFNVPVMLENPVSVISSLWRKPDHIFHPWYYTKYCKDDNYTKKTCLWTTSDFIMPEPAINKKLGPPDDRIHKASPGPNRANFRSATPLGFSRAVYKANRNSVKRPI